MMNTATPAATTQVRIGNRCIDKKVAARPTRIANHLVKSGRDLVMLGAAERLLRNRTFDTLLGGEMEAEMGGLFLEAGRSGRVRKVRANGTQASCLWGQRASSLLEAAPAGRMPARRTAWKAVFRLSGRALRDAENLGLNSRR